MESNCSRAQFDIYMIFFSLYFLWPRHFNEHFNKMAQSADKINWMLKNEIHPDRTIEECNEYNEPKKLKTKHRIPLFSSRSISYHPDVLWHTMIIANGIHVKPICNFRKYSAFGRQKNIYEYMFYTLSLVRRKKRGERKPKGGKPYYIEQIIFWNKWQ